MAPSTGTAASSQWWRCPPLGGDERVELGPQQFLVGQEQIEELLVGAADRLQIGALQCRGHDLRRGC